MLAKNSSDKSSAGVVIAPCSGVGQTVGTISRQAAYTVVDELMPGETMLLCLPAYVANVKEDVEMVERHSSKIVAIEGCGQKCVTKILRERGYARALGFMMKGSGSCMRGMLRGRVMGRLLWLWLMRCFA